MRFELFWVLLLVAFNTNANETEAARKRWAESPHGPFLERILPPGFEAIMLPDPDSRGARLTLRYCVQCHNLANPAMHDARKWPVIVERMVLRMQGRGNMGKLMTEMMAGVVATTGANNLYFDGAPALIFGPEHAATIARDGYSKADVKQYIFEHGRVPLGALRAMEPLVILPRRAVLLVVTRSVPAVHRQHPVGAGQTVCPHRDLRRFVRVLVLG